MYSPAVLDHFRNPRNVGALPEPHGSGRAHNPGCGDEVEITLRLEQGTVNEVRFRAQGCPAVIACSSRLTELVRGIPVVQAAALDAEALTIALEGLPATSRHAAALPVEALRTALARARAALAPATNTVPGRDSGSGPGWNTPSAAHSSVADLPPATTPPRR